MEENSNPRLSKLFDSVDLTSVLSAPIENKATEVIDRANDFIQPEEVETQTSSLDFGPIPDRETEIVQEPELNYNAEQNARSLVYGIQAITSPILTTVGIVKLRQSIGGKKNLEFMRKAVSKEFAGEELDDTDKRLLEAFKVYEKKMQLLQGTILPTDAETENLIKSGIAYCEESKVNVSAGLGFYSNVAGSFVSKITTLLLT